jgi:hypothetical protein
MEMLKNLFKGVSGQKVPTEFATENYDYEAALRDELKKLAGTKSQFRRNKYDIFDLMAESLEEVLPQKVDDQVGMLAEIVTMPQGSRPEFRLRLGKQRAKQFVTRATESGVYETFRLDRDKFDVYIHTYAVGGIVDFERYLDGLEDMADIYEIAVEGLADKVFEEIMGELLASWNHAGRPAANKYATSSFDPATMVKLCNTIAAYGSPVIYCSPEFAAEMTNTIVYDTTVKISDVDMMEVREQGYIGKFRGTPVVVLKQSFTDESNTKRVMNPSFAFVIPAGKEKMFKVILEGGSAFFKEVENEDNSMELQAYKKMGVAMVSTPNYWGIYYNSGIAAEDWEDFNNKLVGEI